MHKYAHFPVTVSCTCSSTPPPPLCVTNLPVLCTGSRYQALDTHLLSMHVDTHLLSCMYLADGVLNPKFAVLCVGVLVCPDEHPCPIVPPVMSFLLSSPLLLLVSCVCAGSERRAPRWGICMRLCPPSGEARVRRVSRVLCCVMLCCVVVWCRVPAVLLC